MAGPIDAIITLPDDTGNTGKKVRTQTKVVGANTVHEHFFIAGKQRKIIDNSGALSVYRLGLAGTAVLAAAQNGTTGAGLWFHVPTAIVSKVARIRRAYITSRHVAAFAATAAGRIAMSRFTFTGTASGATLAAVKVDSSAAAAIADLRTAATGLTVTLVGVLATASLVGSLTAVGAYQSPETDFIDAAGDEDAFVMVRPGEGIVFWQDAAGTASDTRLYDLNLCWDEIDIA